MIFATAKHCAAALLVLAAVISPTVPAGRAAESLPTGAFSFALARTLPGATDAIYDALTGDISGWWDHSISTDPLRFYIEARPGGGFWEIFDASGDGVRHAEVIYAERGSLLRMEGPLGLTGHAITMVTTYELQPVGSDSTLLTVRVHGAGEMHESWPELIEKTWQHFIDDRFQPYIATIPRPTATKTAVSDRGP